jgi:Immunity protein Imm1
VSAAAGALFHFKLHIWCTKDLCTAAGPEWIFMELRINKVLYEVSDLDELRLRLAQARRTQFLEVWLEHAAGWPVICALINGEAAWLMYLRYEGDAGFSTRNPQYTGPKKGVIEYYLSNGQRDEYPAAWNITTAEAFRALEYFLEEAAMAPWLCWYDDTLKSNV